MKVSRWIGILIVAVLMTSITSGFAEELRYQEVFSAYSISSTDAEIDGHKLFIVNDRSWKYGLMDDTGEVRIPIQFENRLSYVGSKYFSARNENEINNLALVDVNGELLTNYQYADFEVLDDNWVLGIKITPTSGELYDYSGWSSGKYLIYAVDVFDFSRGTQVGSFKREEYKRAKVINGEYLLVVDRNDKVQLYDKNVQPVESAYTDYYDDELYITTVGFEKCVVSRITGETVAKGLSRVYGIGKSDLYWVKGEASRSGWGLMDREGKLITALDYDSDYSSNYGGYIEVSYYDKIGLMRLSDGEIVVPCEYDDILYGYNNYDYVCNGYVAVVKDGKVGFVDINGNITCEPKYAKTAVTVLGCTMYATDLDGSVILIAADGTITRDIKALKDYSSSNDGYFLSVQGDNGAWGIIDWHGETVIPYINEDYFNVRGNGFVIYNDTLYRLIRE